MILQRPPQRRELAKRWPQKSVQFSATFFGWKPGAEHILVKGVQIRGSDSIIDHLWIDPRGAADLDRLSPGQKFTAWGNIYQYRTAEGFEFSIGSLREIQEVV